MSEESTAISDGLREYHEEENGGNETTITYYDRNKGEVAFEDSRRRMEAAVRKVQEMLRDTKGEIVGVRKVTQHANINGPTEDWTKLYFFDNLNPSDIEEIREGLDLQDRGAHGHAYLSYIYGDQFSKGGGWHWDSFRRDITYEESTTYLGKTPLSNIKGELHAITDTDNPTQEKLEHWTNAFIFGEPVRTEHEREFIDRIQELFPINEEETAWQKEIAEKYGWEPRTIYMNFFNGNVPRQASLYKNQSGLPDFLRTDSPTE